MPAFLKPIIFIAILLVAIPVLLRVVVSRSGRKSIAPAVYIVLACLLLLGVYLARSPEEAGEPLGPSTVEARP